MTYLNHLPRAVVFFYPNLADITESIANSIATVRQVYYAILPSYIVIKSYKFEYI